MGWNVVPCLVCHNPIFSLPRLKSKVVRLCPIGLWYALVAVIVKKVDFGFDFRWGKATTGDNLLSFLSFSSLRHVTPGWIVGIRCWTSAPRTPGRFKCLFSPWMRVHATGLGGFFWVRRCFHSCCADVPPPTGIGFDWVDMLLIGVFIRCCPVVLGSRELEDHRAG
jgi:hypothetical protein